MHGIYLLLRCPSIPPSLYVNSSLGTHIEYTYYMTKKGEGKGATYCPYRPVPVDKYVMSIRVAMVVGMYV